MSYPSFRSYTKTLRGLLRRRSDWLAKETLSIADLCLTYANLVGLSDKDKKDLFLAAYFKNLGAVFLSNEILEQQFESHSQAMHHLHLRFAESTKLAREAGLIDVAIILDQYYHRAVPNNKLAKVFQVINTWVACRQRKAWRPSMSEQEARSVLEQRATSEWSDPYTVYHFIEYFQQPQILSEDLSLKT